jgi:hypothetical protein
LEESYRKLIVIPIRNKTSRTGTYLPEKILLALTRTYPKIV